MCASEGRVSDSPKQRIPRISPRKAAEIFQDCEQTLTDSQEILANLLQVGFAQFLAVLRDDVLRLAVQPDSWGKRMRARLLSDLAPALQGDLDGKYAVSVEDIAHCASIVMPCLLLELGRRLGHIEIAFPPDPTNSLARFKLSAGVGQPAYSFDNQQLLFLSSRYGSNLVGLCYFGDQQSRLLIERALQSPQDIALLNSPPTDPYKH